MDSEKLSEKLPQQNDSSLNYVMKITYSLVKSAETEIVHASPMKLQYNAHWNHNQVCNHLYSSSHTK